MAERRTLVLFLICFLLQEFPVARGFEWLHSIEEGSSLNHCAGDEVTFPWEFKLDEGEDLIGISWSRLRSGQTKKESIADFFTGKFDSKLGTDLTQVKSEGAGIKLGDLTTADSGQYTVIVRLSSSSDVPVQSLNLTVAEKPETESGILEVLQSNETLEDSTSESASNGYQKLLCGKFMSLGEPKVSVVWEDPDGQLLESTSFDTIKGYFLLSLPARYKGGDYKCMINETDSAFSCLENSSPLREKASLKVTAPVSPVKAAGLGSGAVAGIVIGVLFVVALAVIITLIIVLKLYRRKGKKYSPKEPDSPDQEVTEPFKT